MDDKKKEQAIAPMQNLKNVIYGGVAITLIAAFAIWIATQLLKPDSNKAEIEQVERAVGELKEKTEQVQKTVGELKKLQSKISTIESKLASLSKSLDEVTNSNKKIINRIMEKAINDKDLSVLEIISTVTAPSTKEGVSDFNNGLYVSAFKNFEQSINNGDDTAIQAANAAAENFNALFQSGTISLATATIVTGEANILNFESNKVQLKSVFNDWQ
jgi:seryl-tRNA synthetase